MTGLRNNPVKPPKQNWRKNITMEISGSKGFNGDGRWVATIRKDNTILIGRSCEYSVVTNWKSIDHICMHIDQGDYVLDDSTRSRGWYEFKGGCGTEWRKRSYNWDSDRTEWKVPFALILKIRRELLREWKQ